MKIARHRVAVLDYTLAGDDGAVIDESHDGSFAYLHGAGNILPGLERALAGKGPGESLRVVVEPADGYGIHDPQGTLRIPRERFPAGETLNAGARFQTRLPDGRATIFTITGIEGDDVIVDTNHPLAGRRLHFAVTVLSVRSARKEEIAHGHVHGPGGHHH